MKQYLILMFSLLILLSAAVLFMASAHSHQARPDLPTVQSFWSTPRFEQHQQIFGQTIDLSRYDLHERYEREITNVSYAHNASMLTLKRANRYFPILEPILKEENIPADFIYLCCAESSLSPRAKSPAGAAGLWQFMPETAKQYGLVITDEVDERYNIEKETRAACQYFRDSYKRYGDWMTVAASYNCGPAAISRRQNAQQEQRAMDLFLPEETSRYMFRIMAFKELFRDPYRYGFVLYADQLYRPIRTRKITVKTSIPDLTEFAKRHGTSYLQLKEFNPWLRSDKLTLKPGRTYTVLIPLEEDMHYQSSQPFPVYNKQWIVDR